MINYKINEINKELYLKRIEKYNLNPKLCKNCKSIISYKKKENKFCNNSCAAKFNNVGVVRNKKIIRRKCISCGRSLYKTKEDRCNTCTTKFKILNGEHVGRVQLRNYVINQRGHKCERCNNTHWQEQPISLDIHHIDGNRKNNILLNLLLLCKNCHGITPNYGYRKRIHKSPIV